MANRTIAIASGKGGVGKTVITANLALALARRPPDSKAPVVAMDLDLGCGNLNACLGVRSPNGTINTFLSGKIPSLTPLLTATDQENLKLVCASYDGSPGIQLENPVKENLIRAIRSLNANFVLMDLGAGTSPDVLDLFLSARDKIVVITPESLSLHNAFVFVKTALLRYLWQELEKEDFLIPVKSAVQQMVAGQDNLDIPQLIRKLKDWDRLAAYVVGGLIDDFKLTFVVNMYRGGVERSHLRKFHRLLFKYLQVRSNIGFLGFIHFDHGIPSSVQAIRPFLLRYPNNPAAREFMQIAERMAKDQELDSAPDLPFPEEPSWLQRVFSRW